MNYQQLPQDTKLAGKVVDGHVQVEQTKTERGWLGGMLGSPNSVPANVAGVVALAGSLVLLVAIMKWAGDTSFTYKDAIAALSSLITLALGYLFGRASKG